MTKDYMSVDFIIKIFEESKDGTKNQMQEQIHILQVNNTFTIKNIKN
jgi:hypothetical protein